MTTPEIPNMPVDTPEALEIQHQTLQASAMLRIMILQNAENAGQVLTEQLRRQGLIRDDQYAKLHLSVECNGMLYDAHPLDPDAAPPQDRIAPQALALCERCERVLQEGETPPLCADCKQGSE